MTASTKPCVYRSETRHRRLRPFRRTLRYSISQVYLDVDRVSEIAGKLRLFGHNRFNLFSFHDADHGALGALSLRDWASATLAKAGVETQDATIMLLCMPRMLGFVFNPLSIFFAIGADGALRGTLYEVRNTFGERHVYVVRAAQDNCASAEKSFHVSPFFDVRGGYRFRLHPPAQRFFLSIANETQEGVEHVATLRGVRQALTDSELVRTFFLMPFMTIGVICAIHWEAAFIWLRGARYRRKPPPPLETFTISDEALSVRKRLDLAP